MFLPGASIAGRTREITLEGGLERRRGFGVAAFGQGVARRSLGFRGLGAVSELGQGEGRRIGKIEGAKRVGFKGKNACQIPSAFTVESVDHLLAEVNGVVAEIRRSAE